MHTGNPFAAWLNNFGVSRHGRGDRKRGYAENSCSRVRWIVERYKPLGVKRTEQLQMPEHGCCAVQSFQAPVFLNPDTVALWLPVW
jgi:hypothetical protein